jgi:hypothetical protein
MLVGHSCVFHLRQGKRQAKTSQHVPGTKATRQTQQGVTPEQKQTKQGVVTPEEKQTKYSET